MPGDGDDDGFDFEWKTDGDEEPAPMLLTDPESSDWLSAVAATVPANRTEKEQALLDIAQYTRHEMTKYRRKELYGETDDA